MKTKMFLFMLLAASSLNAQNKLTIVVEGIEDLQGHLIVGLYDEENFRKQPLNGAIVKVEEEISTIVLENVVSGEYAVAVYQDENDNQKLDTGLFGIPTEKYGFSNNAQGKMGPPAYADCKFAVEGDTEIHITL
jgi:uncharacterized protein (DUF2141 family)